MIRFNSFFFLTLFLFSLVSGKGLSQSKKGGESLEPVLAKAIMDWDKNKNKMFDKDEVDAAVINARVKNREAVLAAAIHVWFRNSNTTAPVSPRSLLQPLRFSEKSKKDGSEVEKTFDLKTQYSKFFKSLANTNRQAFVGNAPNILGVRQGALGDCFFYRWQGHMPTCTPIRFEP